MQIQGEKRERAEIEKEDEKKRRLQKEEEAKRSREFDNDRKQKENKKPRGDDYEDIFLLKFQKMQEARSNQTRSNRTQAKEDKAVTELLSVSAKDKVWNPEQRAHHPDDFHEVLSQAWDDITGAELDRREVRKARMTEIGYPRDKKVWTKIPRSTAVRNGWKVIKSKWTVGTNFILIYENSYQKAH